MKHRESPRDRYVLPTAVINVLPVERRGAFCTFLLGLILSGPAIAGDAKINCTLTTKRTDIAGVRYHYGRSPGVYDKVWVKGSPTDCSATITGLAPGKWYFVARSYTATGEESASSNEVTREIQESMPVPVLSMSDR